MERTAARLERVVTVVSVPLIWLAVAVLMVATLAGVVQFSIRAVNATMFQELSIYAFFALVMLSLGLTYIRDGHVRIDFIAERFGPRQQAWIEIIGILVVLLPLTLLLIWDGGLSTWTAWRIGESSDDVMGLPWRWVLKAFVPGGFALLLLAGLARLLRCLALLGGRRRP
ncbi:MAG TPA: TRAP transporter small permease subunit [Alphaproteobacteria bacterium]|nr:TRAP transporter small permease subunit [Alphaproteobacteria bacterium]